MLVMCVKQQAALFPLQSNHIQLVKLKLTRVFCSGLKIKKKKKQEEEGRGNFILGLTDSKASAAAVIEAIQLHP